MINKRLLIFGPKWSLYYTNANRFNEVTATINQYGWSSAVRYS